MDTRPLRRPAYRRLWSSTIVTAVGSQLTAVAVPKQIYDMTGSSAWVGIASLAGLAAAGRLRAVGRRDRRQRRPPQAAAGHQLRHRRHLAAGLLAAGRRWTATPCPLLMVLVALQQALLRHELPARTASVARLVPADELPAAERAQLDRHAGRPGRRPAARRRPDPAASACAGCTCSTPSRCASRCGPCGGCPSLPPLGGGARRAGLARRPRRFPLPRPHKAALAVLPRGHHRHGLRHAPRAVPAAGRHRVRAVRRRTSRWACCSRRCPIGALLGGLLSGTFSHVRRHGLMVVVAVCAWGAAIAGFGLSSSACGWPWCSSAAAGVADMVSMVFRGAILQAAATDEMRGRMQGVHTVVVAGGPRLADLLHGTAGVRPGRPHGRRRRRTAGHRRDAGPGGRDAGPAALPRSEHRTGAAYPGPACAGRSAPSVCPGSAPADGRGSRR